MIITKILLPRDGTEICERVIENTKGFARVSNADILLLRVIEHIAPRCASLLDIDKTWIAQTKRSRAKN